MKIDGSCHCGAVRYEASVDPGMVVVCHCNDCQALSGSAFRVVVATEPGTFKLTAGGFNTYVKMGESGNPREQTFCPVCGSPIYSAPVGDGPRVLSLRLGTIRQRAELTPAVQFWTRSALPWTGDLETIPRMETQPVFGSSGSFGDKKAAAPE